MSPRGSAIFIGCVLLVLVCAGVTRAQGATAEETLEGWLEHRGLHGLVAAQLERRIDGAEGRRKQELAERLAGVYAKLLELAGQGARRDELVARGRRLLDTVPEADTVELRLSLARAAYTGVESSVERVRLRMEGGEDPGALAAHLVGLEEQFRKIGVLADQKVRALEKQEEMNSGQADDDLLSRTLGEARRHRSLAHYYGGWSCVYIAELEPETRDDYAAAALRHFGWLLNAKRGQRAEVSRVPDGMMGYEHVARSAVGCALASALSDQGETARAWLALIESDQQANKGVGDRLGVYRVLAMGYAGAWNAALDAVNDERDGGQIDALVARLVGVLALEARGGGRGERSAIEQLTTISLGELVALNETGHVLDLVSRYPHAVREGDGFMSTFLRALRAYDEAHGAHTNSGGNPDEPAADPSIRAVYLRAGMGFADAYRASDASDYQGALASVAVLRGLSLFYGSENPVGFGEAAAWFERAWEALGDIDPDRAREAMWMAVRSAGAGAALGSAALASERDVLVREFVGAYPDDPRTSLVVFERAVDAGRDPERAVAELLSITRGSAVYESARREAAGMLYRLYKDAPPDRRAWAARRYAEIAEPLLYVDARDAMNNDERAVARAVLRARRVAEVLLGSPEPDGTRAGGALDVLVGLIARGAVEGGVYEQEIHYRRAQIALLDGEYDEAERLISAMEVGGGSGADAGARLLYRDSLRRFRGAAGDGELLDSAEGVVRHGRRVIASLLDAGTAPVDGVLMSVQSEVAHAAAELWRVRGDRAQLELADSLVSVLLNAQPYDEGLLRLGAELSEASGDEETALARWRVLVTGLPAGSDEWFEARANHIRVLALVDLVKAAEAIEQHSALYPDYGPEPWGDELRALHARLRRGGGDGG